MTQEKRCQLAAEIEALELRWLEAKKTRNRALELDLMEMLKATLLVNRKRIKEALRA